PQALLEIGWVRLINTPGTRQSAGKMRSQDVLCVLRPRVSDCYTDLSTLSFTYIPGPSGHGPELGEHPTARESQKSITRRPFLSNGNLPNARETSLGGCCFSKLCSEEAGVLSK